MRIFGLFILSIILCLSLGFASCSDEQEGEFEQSKVGIASKVNTRSVGYIPDWWDGKTQLEAPYEYQTSYWDHPYSPDAVDTCTYYFSFVYSWGNSYALQYYDRLQMQYRYAPDRYEDYHTIEDVPDSEWHNIGEIYPKDRYKGGIIQRTGRICELDIDAYHLPKAKLNIRYRLLHNHYPYDLDEYYNVLCTKWRTVFIGNNAIYNTYGFTSVGYLYIHVNYPMDGRDYVCSVFVDSEQVMDEEGVYICKKSKKEGKYEVTAMMHVVMGVVGIYRNARIEGTYDEDSRDIYVNFKPEDFQY